MKNSIVNRGKDIFLSHYIKTKLLAKLQTLKHGELSTYTLEMSQDYLNLSYSYRIYLPLNFSVLMEHEVCKKNWLFGNEADLFANDTLFSLLKKEEENESKKMVYKTKTGRKFHMKNCFYLIKKGTDHRKIIKITLKVAKDKYGLSPCLKCLKGGMYESK